MKAEETRKTYLLGEMGNHSYFNENEYKPTTFSSIVKYRMAE